MSYIRPQSDDLLRDFIKIVLDFNKESHHLLEAKTEEEFCKCLDRLMEIDRCCMAKFARRNKDQIKPEWFEIIRERLKHYIID